MSTLLIIIIIRRIRIWLIFFLVSKLDYLKGDCSRKSNPNFGLSHLCKIMGGMCELVLEAQPIRPNLWFSYGGGRWPGCLSLCLQNSKCPLHCLHSFWKFNKPSNSGFSLNWFTTAYFFGPFCSLVEFYLVTCEGGVQKRKERTRAEYNGLRCICIWVAVKTANDCLH